MLAPILALASAMAQQPAPTGPAGGGQSMNPDLSFVADVALAGFTSDEPLQGGAHDPVKSGFNLQQLEMSIGKPVDPYFRFDANVVFSQFGVEIEEVYATTLALPARTQIRAGQFLTRFGRINPTHPHSWDFVDQPFAISRVFGGEGNRGLGAEGSILLPLPWFAEAFVSSTDAAGAATARSFYGADDLGVDSPVDLQTTAALKQFFPLGSDLSLAWGLSWAGGPNPTGRDNRTEVYGSDLYVKYRPVEGASWTALALQGEVLHRRRQVPGDVLADWNAYGYVAWRFSRRWGTGARVEWGSPATGSAEDVVDALDPEWTADRVRITAQTTFWPTEFSRLRLQAARDDAAWRDEADWSAMLAFEFTVGAHGSHAF